MRLPFNTKKLEDKQRKKCGMEPPRPWDTNADLTLTTNVPWTDWSRLQETLGNDHLIIKLDAAHSRTRTKTGIECLY